MADATRVDGWSVGVGGIEDHWLMGWIHFAGTAWAMHHPWMHDTTLRTVWTLGPMWSLWMGTWPHLHGLHHARGWATVGIIKRILHHHVATVVAPIVASVVSPVVFVGRGWCLWGWSWIRTRQQLC